MDISTKGLIIKEQKIGDNDKLITILTDNYGVIRAFVKNANSIKSKNLSSTGLLTLSRFLIYKGRDKYIVKEANSVEVFFELRNSIEKLSLAQYFCELIMNLNIKEEESKQLLSLILNSLFFLCNGKIDCDIIKSVVEMRTLSIVGFMPDLVCCNECKCYESDKMYWLLDKGVIYCESCYNGKNKTAVALPKSTLRALRYIIYSDKNKIFNFCIIGDSKKILGYVTEKYVKMIVGKNFLTLDLYKSLK